MSTEQHEITVAGVPVEIVRKAIKNLHLGVYPPTGRVRVAAPLAVTDEAVRLAVLGKLAWIKRQRARFQAQPRQTEREFVSGESHYLFGRRYRLRLVPHDGAAFVTVRTRTRIELHIAPGSSVEQRAQVLQRWYRERLREVVPPLLSKWESALGVSARAWGIRRMKTRWGTCNAAARRILLNTELAKKPLACIEYIVAHELTHLRRRKHDDAFLALMDQHLPHWRRLRAQLNDTPLSSESWR